ncbi:exonuclease domain-containing protein [Nocardiopsis halophila]|uniref:exonuclease domain-containing protein n=1 Tax=Nocardiopsis halophila TaxID=141692 RepID=UPI00036DD927|nr:exonuclease domain-containing protein [Nocardiopsis halophila]
MSGYAVVDVETTGITPASHHRVVEVAVVHVDDSGEVGSEWSTLLNPGRDLGAGHVHRIRAREVRKAPLFEEVAGDLAELLRGRVVVAHNLPFDVRFLAAEYARMGVEVPLSPSQGLCTMGLSRRYLRGTGKRSLEGCCRSAGLRLVDAHSALGDAHAAAGLLRHYLAAAPTPRPWAELLAACAALDWPHVQRSGRATVTRSQAGEGEAHFLERIVERLPGDTATDAADPYLAVLDRALVDRHLSAAEADELVDTARYLGISRETVAAAHHRYLAALADAAWEDGVVTGLERADLQNVAALLGMPPDSVGKELRRAEAERTCGGSAAGGRSAAPPASAFVLDPGDQVVFTGTSRRSRDDWHGMAVEAGLVPKNGVTRQTRILVAADPDSLSGKAKKARERGIPVITEEAFEKLLEAMG